MSYEHPTETTPVQPATTATPADPVPPAASVPPAAPRAAAHVNMARPPVGAKPRRLALRLGATFSAMKAALQWRLLVLWAGLMLVPAFIAAFPFWSTFKTSMDYSVHATELASKLDALALSDLQIAFKPQAGFVTGAAVMALIVTFLLSPLLTGMVATAARAPAAPRFRELVAGGIGQYPRMLFMLLWALVPMGIAMAIYGIASGAADEVAAKAITPAQADNAHHIALAVLVLAVVFFHSTVEAGRAVLALDRRRVSPFKAWWDGVKLVLRQPVATMGSYVVVSVVALAIAGALGVLRIGANGPSAGAFWFAMLLTQAIALVIAWMRCARMMAQVELAKP